MKKELKEIFSKMKENRERPRPVIEGADAWNAWGCDWKAQCSDDCKYIRGMSQEEIRWFSNQYQGITGCGMCMKRIIAAEKQQIDETPHEDLPLLIHDTCFPDYLAQRMKNVG